jgi:hypothetical protein
MLGVSRAWLYEAAKSGRVPLCSARQSWLPGDSTADTLHRAAAA